MTASSDQWEQKGSCSWHFASNGAFSSGTILEQHDAVWYVCQISRDAMVRPSQFGLASQSWTEDETLPSALDFIRKLEPSTQCKFTIFLQSEKKLQEHVREQNRKIAFQFQKSSLAPRKSSRVSKSVHTEKCLFSKSHQTQAG